MNLEIIIPKETDGHSYLELVIDGHRALILEPKLTLLEEGIVVLLDPEDTEKPYWGNSTEVEYPLAKLTLKGATREPAIIAAVRNWAKTLDA